MIERKPPRPARTAMRCEIVLAAFALAACNGAMPATFVAPPPAPAGRTVETIRDPWLGSAPAAETAPRSPTRTQLCTADERGWDESPEGQACAARDEEYFRRVAAVDPTIDLGAPSDFNVAQSFDPDLDLTSHHPDDGMYLTAEQAEMTRWPSLMRATIPLMVNRDDLLSNLRPGLRPAKGFAACKGETRSSPYAEHVPACGDALVKNFALLYQRLPSKMRDPGCRPANLLDPAFRYANDAACAPPASWKKHGGIALEKVCAPVGVYLLLRAVTPYASRYGQNTFAQNIEYIAQTLGVVQRLTAKSTLATPECKLIPVRPVFMPKP
jgi:hypothetical protein